MSSRSSPRSWPSSPSYEILVAAAAGSRALRRLSARRSPRNHRRARAGHERARMPPPRCCCSWGLGAVLILMHGNVLLVSVRSRRGAALGRSIRLHRRESTGLTHKSRLIADDRCNVGSRRGSRSSSRAVASPVSSSANCRGRAAVWCRSSSAPAASSAVSFTAVSIISALIWSALYLLPALVARALIA